MECFNYSSDCPVSGKTEDRFSRWHFSEKIAEIISKRNDPSSLVLGLYGAWGSGKTTVLNFICESLEKDDSVVVLKFNPWRFVSEEDLLSEFFSSVANAVGVNLTTTAEEGGKIVTNLLAVGAAFFGAGDAVERAGKMVINWPELEKLKERLEKTLQEANRKLLVIIDDVDRLEKSEVQSIFKLVKLTADFKNTVYLLSFDKDIVAASLQERYSASSVHAGEAFLEKIIQVPLHLPIASRKALRTTCLELVDEAITIAGIELTERQARDFVQHFDSGLFPYITTPRKARLYGNSLLFALPFLVGEVNPVDLMLIEGVRIFYPELYEVISKNGASFSGVADRGEYGSDDKKCQTRALIDQVFEEKKSELEDERILSLLKFLFPKLQAVYGNFYVGANSNTWDKQQRICSSNYFSRYFERTINSDDVADHNINLLLEECSKQVDVYHLKSVVEEFVCTEKSASFITKLRQYEEGLGSTTSENLCYAICSISGLLAGKYSSSGWDSPYFQATFCLGNLFLNLEDPVPVVVKCIDLSEENFSIMLYDHLPKYNENYPDDAYLPEDVIEQCRKHLAAVLIKWLPSSNDIVRDLSFNFAGMCLLLKEAGHFEVLQRAIVNYLASRDDGLNLLLENFAPDVYSSTGKVFGDIKDRTYDEICECVGAELVFSHIDSELKIKHGDQTSYPSSNTESIMFLHQRQFLWFYSRSQTNGV